MEVWVKAGRGVNQKEAADFLEILRNEGFDKVSESTFTLLGVTKDEASLIFLKISNQAPARMTVDYKFFDSMN